MMRKKSVEIISMLLVLLFVYAAISKLLNYHLFMFQLSKSPFVADFARTISWLLPLTELSVVFLLITAKLRAAGLYASLMLMFLFTSYIYAILNYADHVPCSCGGLISHLSWSQHMTFNIVIILLNVIAILMDAPEARGASIATRHLS